jgi:hypothetical protein
MDKQFQNQYAFIELEDGDRFYFVGDTKKEVWQAEVTVEPLRAKIIKVKKQSEAHANLPTYKQRNTNIIFLRHAGTK